MQTNFNKLINNEEFWRKYTAVAVNMGVFRRIREYRSKGSIPRKSTLLKWVEEDYKFITGDTRDTREIMLWLASNSK